MMPTQGIGWVEMSIQRHTKQDTCQICCTSPRGGPANIWGCSKQESLLAVAGKSKRRGNWGQRVAKTGSKEFCCDSDQMLTKKLSRNEFQLKKAIISQLFGMPVWITNILGWVQGYHNPFETSSKRSMLTFYTEPVMGTSSTLILLMLYCSDNLARL